ncbi:hypothetical protein Psi01_84780 [Planobispora siamensis]|uniref:Uncharacterized protein n=1 Tax=Planobispora siamensis TaxID=936338 RepID=A0A8J3WPZ8_9ACTN|nr:hypothetical protein Psi01_84780 [Planobispora siamensis]
MPSVAGRERRTYGTGGQVPFATRMPKWLKEEYDAAAQRQGLSLSRLLEELIKLEPLLSPREADDQPADQLSA